MANGVSPVPINRVLAVLPGVLCLVTLVVGFIAVQVDTEYDPALQQIQVVAPGVLG